MVDIEEIKIKDLDNKPPSFKANLYPRPNNRFIQKPYFICCAVGARGSGKSYIVVKLLSNQEKSGFKDAEEGQKVGIRHILFSPTFEANPIFSTLKYLNEEEDVHNEFTEQKLLDVLSEVKHEREETKKYKEYKIAFEKYDKMSDDEFERWDDYDAIGLLYSNNFVHWRKIVPPKYPNGCVTNIVLDDCLAEKNCFSQKKSSALVKAVLNSRHYGVNIIMCSQNLKSINKSIRSNTDLWFLFKFKSEKIILNDLYEEISGMLSPEEFLLLFDYATSDEFPNSCLCIDGKAEKGERFKRNLDNILRLK